MKNYLFPILFLTFISCNTNVSKEKDEIRNTDEDYIIVFGSCNNQEKPQPLWQPIIDNRPNLFIWGGDNVYADTEDMNEMQSDYNKVWSNALYKKLSENTEIIGTWDDHDYGKNDAGLEWEYKEKAQQLFLDFLKVSDDDMLRQQQGVYSSKMLHSPEGKIKVILLDTRYFRTSLKPSSDPNRRYDSWGADNQEATILGDKQWRWLENELEDSEADFTVIVTSIQFLSNKHGWEKWANFPNETEKMHHLLVSAKAKNIVLLSGDRHMAEISKADIDSKNYPLIELTSSGLTHTQVTSATEENSYRISNVIKQLNFSVLRFNFKENRIVFEIRGKNNFLYESYTQQY